MTIGHWLDTRTPVPPAELTAVLREALGARVNDDAAAVPDAALDAAHALLARALAAGCRDRAQAVGLLAADALVTYAFEAAADEPERLGERAGAAMARLARLAAARAGEGGAA